MLREVNALEASDNTPTGYAYAEVAAYMMGQTTKGSNRQWFYRIDCRKYSGY
jgi:hypothetical protein